MELTVFTSNLTDISIRRHSDLQQLDVDDHKQYSHLIGLDNEKPMTGNVVGRLFYATDTGLLYRWNGTTWQVIKSPSKFTQLNDVPSNYSGQGGKAVAVKPSEDGLQFVSGLLGSVKVGAGHGNIVNPTANTWNNITGWSEILDNQNIFDPTTGIFIPPTTGYYLLIYKVRGYMNNFYITIDLFNASNNNEIDYNDYYAVNDSRFSMLLCGIYNLIANNQYRFRWYPTSNIASLNYGQFTLLSLF
jgi:hypothetical protein